ncbi:MAG TPA: L-histidine N(alpha)-methyltransferase [Candidatus Eremiobacteraceae bacterium]|nr:L-histidine N(alpha)-methyltransferase [Candidatus Eremiobacteraceae bacterium]
MPFAEDVRAGLTARPKTLPAKYFYDDLGSTLFEAITLLPEYYLTRAETQIFRTHGQAMIDLVQPVRLVELGSGSAIKTRILLDAALRRNATLHYTAIDISRTALEAAARALEAEYPALTVQSYPFDYNEGLRQIAKAPAGRTLALFLGSNIGNFEPPEAVRLLQSIRAVLQSGDALLLGTDLKKDAVTLEAAYDDPQGVTAAFNRNVLARINRELGGGFDLRAFRHRARYDARTGRVEMHLESAASQRIAIRQLDLEIGFEPGETIWTESSYKFDTQDVTALASAANFRFEQAWLDEAGSFACNLLRA